jgi:hypothetical protein
VHCRPLEHVVPEAAFLFRWWVRFGRCCEEGNVDEGVLFPDPVVAGQDEWGWWQENFSLFPQKGARRLETRVIERFGSWLSGRLNFLGRGFFLMASPRADRCVMGQGEEGLLA